MTKFKLKRNLQDPLRGGNIRTTSDNFFENNSEIFDVILLMACMNMIKLKKILLIL